MLKEIIEEAKSKILALKEVKIAEEIAKVESEMIAPKFVEFDNEYQNSVAIENKRHADEIQRLAESNELNKKEYANRIKGAIESNVENKYRYNQLINALNKLQGE